MSIDAFAIWGHDPNCPSPERKNGWPITLEERGDATTAYSQYIGDNELRGIHPPCLMLQTVYLKQPATSDFTLSTLSKSVSHISGNA